MIGWLKARSLSGKLAKAQADRDDALNSRLDDTHVEGDRLQTIILKETASAPRYALLTACARPSTIPVGYLVVPRLTPQAASPCPPAHLLADSTLGALAAADAALAAMYAAGQAKHESVVASYQAAFDAAERARIRERP